MPNRVQRRRTKPSQAQRLRAELTRCELRRPSVRAGLRELGLDGDDLELLDAIVAAPMDNAGLHHKYRRALAKVIRRSERQITRRLTRMVELGVLTRIAPPKVPTTEAGVETWESLDCNGYRLRLASLDNPSRPSKHRRDTNDAPLISFGGRGPFRPRKHNPRPSRTDLPYATKPRSPPYAPNSEWLDEKVGPSPYDRPMAGTTPNGLPYPDPTDPVTAGADDIRRLAESVNGWIDQLAAWNTLTKSGRFDRAVESNGYLRLLAEEVFFPSGPPASIVVMGVNPANIFFWDGTMDGAGALLGVYTGAGFAAQPPGTVVAGYYIATATTGRALTDRGDLPTPVVE